MKLTVPLMALFMFMSICALGQPDPSALNPGGAPTAMAPISPDAMNLAPPETIASNQAPASQERSQGLIMADQQSAYFASSMLRGTSPTYTQIVSPRGYVPNNLYVFSAPQTVASCNLYSNLPLWMKISGGGNIWFYEWYPNGQQDVQYAGNIFNSGWYKRWFFGDAPGWHILQYYCNGWSNYVYVYVYSAKPYYRVGPYDPGPYDPGPYDPGPYDPGPYDPGPYDPGPYDPGPYDPGPYDPEPYDPGPYDPGPYDPGL